MKELQGLLGFMAQRVRDAALRHWAFFWLRHDINAVVRIHPPLWVSTHFMPWLQITRLEPLDGEYRVVPFHIWERLLAAWRRFELPGEEKRYQGLHERAMPPRRYSPEFYDCDDFAIDFLAWCHRQFRINTVTLTFNHVHAFNIVLPEDTGPLGVEPQNGLWVKIETDGLYGMRDARSLF